MKKNSQRRPKPKLPRRPAGAPAGQEGAHAATGHEEKKVGIVSHTHADVFDESAEHKHDKLVAIFISILAVLIAIAETGNNDAMKVAQQAGIQVNDNYAFYQAKVIRQGQLKVAFDQLELKAQEMPNLPEPARKLLSARKADYGKEITRLEYNRRNGKKELLARAQSCENLRNHALAQHPFFDYSGAVLQIAIVLASASIVTGVRLLFGLSGAVGLFGVLLFLNGHFLVYGAPLQSYEKIHALEKAMPLMRRWEAHKIARCPIE
jgi:Domain of unknown function (DUF4337)